jgi:glycosyltransferase involved in cell wall biosynthesis
MRTIIPLTVTARNEEAALGACLASLLAAARRAAEERPVSFEITVVLDRCRDRSAAVAAQFPVQVLACEGGKIEAQRRGLRPGLFNVFSDADITVTDETLRALWDAMIEHPGLQIAFPPKAPLPPRRRSLLAHALHRYNAARGYSSSRSWFSGKLFAIRRWAIPGRAAVAARAATLPHSRFHAYSQGLLADDIFLSRQCLMQHGPSALAETTAGLVHFRAPETWEGMYRYYRRLRRELDRTSALFPETEPVHRRHGRRVQDLLARAPFRERRLHDLFRLALAGCRARYRGERFVVDVLGWPAGDPWPAIAESKQP